MAAGRASKFSLGLGFLWLGCGGSPRGAALAPASVHPAPGGQGKASTAPVTLAPARVFPPTERTEVSLEVFDPDGSRRLIAQGVRLIERPGGALELADELLPASRVLTPVALPPQLGGGWIFAVNAGGAGLLWHAPAWTAKLRALARLEGEIERVVPGFDRLYVLRARGAPWVALDLESGRALELGSLPPSPGYGSMLFFDEWLGVVSVPLRGVLATFDAGGAWHPLGLASAQLFAEDRGVRLEMDGKRLLLGPEGSLSPLADAPPPARAPTARVRAPTPLGPRPLETAVLHGYAEREGTALVATRGALARVSLSDGAVLDLVPDAYGGQASCDAVMLGAGPGFVCGESHGATTVYAVAGGLALEPVVHFAEPRRVAPNGRGALLVDGACAERGAADPVRCVIPPAGAPYEIPRRSTNERAVALAGGGVAILEPAPKAPRKPAGDERAAGEREKTLAKPLEEPVGTLRLVQPGAGERTAVLRLTHVDDEAARALVESGYWLDSFEQEPDGDLRGWVAGGSSFVGVRVKLDGRVLVGSPEPHLERALLSGRFGLVVGRARSLRETIDGGFEWSDGELPAEPDLRVERTFGKEQGCTPLGCVTGGWLRVGWTMGNTSRLAIAPLPEPTRLLGSGSNRWSLECRATGEQSRPALRQTPQPEDRSLSPWNPLAELAPPPHARSDASYEIANEAELRLFHAYAWGPPADGWARDARFLVRVRDPYRVADAAWSTAPAPSPWSSAALAADAFGRSPNGPPATFRVVTDPVKHVGLLLVSSKGALDLYTLGEGRPVSRVKTSGAVGIVTSVALAGGRLYVSALGENRSLRLYRIEAGALELLGEFADLGASAEPPTLAPATQGDGLAVWVHEADYYLFPFDPAARRFDPPIVTRARDMAAMPASCTTGEDGYVVGDALSLEPNIELLGTPEGVSTGNGIEVRLVVGPSRLCTDALAAPLGARSHESNHPPGSSGNAKKTRRGAFSDIGVPSAEMPGSMPPHGVSERDGDPGTPLVLNLPDGSRRAFRCRD